MKSLKDETIPSSLKFSETSRLENKAQPLCIEKV
jgi:hypothetical protein